MKKSIPSNSKISHTILCMIFSILFIFTALKFSSPLTAYAEGDESENNDPGGEQVHWLGEVDAGGMDYVYIPGKIYWGGSISRTGLLFYCVDRWRLYHQKALLHTKDSIRWHHNRGSHRLPCLYPNRHHSLHLHRCRGRL